MRKHSIWHTWRRHTCASSVTDVVMPRMDGWALGRRLAVDCPAVPVLYMSAYPRADIFHRGHSSASVPFLEKPFSPEVFVKTVRGLLDRAGTLPDDSPSGTLGSPGAVLPSPPQSSSSRVRHRNPFRSNRRASVGANRTLD